MIETYPLSALEELEAEAMRVLREAAAESERPAVLAATDPQLACLQRLAQKAFAPGAVPFPLKQDAGAAGVFPLAEWSEQDVAHYLAGDKVQADLLRVVIAGEGAAALVQGLRRDFSSARRRLLVSDAPGGDAHARALAAGAAGAELAILVVGAKQGLGAQTRRDAFVCSLFGIPRVVVAINTEGSGRERFDAIRADFEAFAARLSFKSITFLPCEAAALHAHLESVYIGGDRNLVDFRFPVQSAARTGAERWVLGRVASGVVKVGDEVVVLPSHRRSRVRALRLGEQPLEYAYAPLSVALSLEDDLDVGRGAMLAHARNVPRAARSLDAMVLWLDGQPLAAGKVYLLKHGAHWVRASCAEVNYRMDADSLHRGGGHELGANEIGRAAFTLFEERFVDPFAKNRGTGSFVVADAESRRTVGAGVILDRETDTARVKPGEAAKRVVIPHASKVTAAHRAQLLGQSSITIWLTGLSGSGKSTLATELEKRLMGEGRACYMLDGDNVRAGINRDLGFGPDDRRENIRRIAEVAKLMNDAGLIAVTAFISPYRADRDMARAIVGEERFIEVFVDASLEVCEGRDPKGLYRKARKGEIPEFTGISAPYEAPAAPALSVDTAARSIGQCVDELLALVLQRSRR